MWTDLFKPRQLTSSKPSVDCVDCVEAHSRPAPMRLSGDASTSPRALGESVDCVELPMIDTIDTGRHHAMAPAMKYATPDKTQPHQGCQVTSTLSTLSTPAKRQTLFNRSEKFAILAQFGMENVPDDVQTHVEAGYAAEEIRRVNNLAWRLMTTKGMAFDTAMEVAADWVVHNPEHPDEKKFTDVMTLYLGGDKNEDEPKTG